MLERLRCVRSLSIHRLRPGCCSRVAARRRRGCHWGRRQDDSELITESSHCGIHRQLAFKKVSYFQIQKLFHDFFHSFRVSVRKLSLLLEDSLIANGMSYGWLHGARPEMKDYVGRTDSAFNECHGWCRAETTGSSPIKSTIKSRHPDIPGKV